MLHSLYKKYGDDFSWFELPSSSTQKRALEERLLIEITPEHPLYDLSKTLAVVAKSERNDNILCFDGKSYYIIHLTWSNGSAAYPRFRVVPADHLMDFLENDHNGADIV